MCSNVPVSRTITYYIRNLPHWHPPETDLFITWRLFGSLPRQTPPPKATSSPGAAFVHYDHILDVARTGPLWLKDPRIAESILASLKNGHDRKLFNLRAYAVMANHIHVLLMPIAPLAKLTQLVKGATARQANLILSDRDALLAGRIVRSLGAGSSRGAENSLLHRTQSGCRGLCCPPRRLALVQRLAPD